jgi:hypothetical protein
LVNDDIGQKVLLNLKQVVKLFQITIFSFLIGDVDELGVIRLEKLLWRGDDVLEVQSQVL